MSRTPVLTTTQAAAELGISPQRKVRRDRQQAQPEFHTPLRYAMPLAITQFTVPQKIDEGGNFRALHVDAVRRMDSVSGVDAQLDACRTGAPELLRRAAGGKPAAVGRD